MCLNHEYNGMNGDKTRTPVIFLLAARCWYDVDWRFRIEDKVKQSADLGPKPCAAT